MPRSTTLFFIFILVSSCTRHAYYQSPFATNNHPYRTLPLQRDSVKSAMYASGALAAGGANEHLRDEVYMVNLSAYRAHNLRNFKAYYGITGSAGSYEVKNYRDTTGRYSFFNPSYINQNSGEKFTAGAGGIGGANFVLPFKKGGELRLGIETSVQREFGEFLEFRQKMPDSSANVINRYQTDGTLCFSFDLIGRSQKNGSSFGWKLARVITLNKQLYILSTFDERFFRSNSLSNTFHYTDQQITGFIQINFGSYAANFQTGIIFRLGKRIGGF